MSVIYSYVLKTDSGFAPNPYGGLCTLACCKPAIRRSTQVGDWIVGWRSWKHGRYECVVYAMQVTRKVAWEEYARGPWQDRGDNIYDYSSKPAHAGYLIRGKRWFLRPGKEYHGHDTNAAIQKDVGRGQMVLISEHFHYFGKSAVRMGMPAVIYKEIVLAPHQRRSGKRVDKPGIAEELEKWLRRVAGNGGSRGEPIDASATVARWELGISVPKQIRMIQELKALGITW